MFSRLTRLPLQRCLHTRAGASRSANVFSRSAKVVFGASAVTATYLTWRLAQDSHQIALDSPQNRSHATPLTRPATKSSFSPPHPEPTPELTFVPDTPSSSEGELSPSEPLSELEVAPDEPTSEDGDVEQEGAAEGASGQGGAFNPETGEINWDCPCLGGMAHGPCGPEFREAFSCFIFSEAEPKGINCVEKFQGMQDCFRAHPEIYADEIANDDDED
ncbi:hypothetical protein B0H34DRAFT_636367, partial [Crassisporium funariophilum]